MARAHLHHHYFCFIVTGSCGAGTGISSRVLSNSRCQELSATIDADVQCLQQGVDDLTDSLSSLAEVALQNRRGLDLLFLQQGGLCAALKEECCFYVDKTGLVKESMKKVGGGGRMGEGGRRELASKLVFHLPLADHPSSIFVGTLGWSSFAHIFWPMGL